MGEGRWTVAALRGVERVFRGVSPGTARRLGRGMGWVYGSVVRYHRAEAREALARAFPERTEAAREAILRDMYAGLGQMLAETFRMADLTDEALEDLISFRDLHYAKTIHEQGRGLLVATGHVGNWEMLCALIPRYGFGLHAIVKTIRPPALNDYVVRLRTRYGLQLLPPRNAYRQCLKVVKRGDVLGFIIDQNRTRRDGVFVDFFGRPACTSPGLAYLSAQLQVPVVPVFNLRQPDGRFVVECLPPIEPPADRSPESIVAATQAYTKALESVVRRHPEQWTWIHRRWRTTPPETDSQNPDAVV